jgi:dihydroxy-acid dehydratase
VGGPIILVQNGDQIELDIPNRRLTLLVPEEELSRRQERWQAPPATVAEGYLARYAAMVSSASEGAILK